MNEKEIEVTESTSGLNYLERKNIQLRGEIQCLTDRIAGLTKENESLRREARMHRTIAVMIDRFKNIVESIKSIFKKEGIEQ